MNRSADFSDVRVCEQGKRHAGDLFQFTCRRSHVLADRNGMDRAPHLTDRVDRGAAIGGRNPAVGHRAVEGAGNVGHDDGVEPECFGGLPQQFEVGGGEMPTRQNIDAALE